MYECYMYECYMYACYTYECYLYECYMYECYTEHFYISCTKTFLLLANFSRLRKLTKLFPFGELCFKVSVWLLCCCTAKLCRKRRANSLIVGTYQSR